MKLEETIKTLLENHVEDVLATSIFAVTPFGYKGLTTEEEIKEQRDKDYDKAVDLTTRVILNMIAREGIRTATKCMKIVQEEDGGGEIRFVKSLGSRIINRIGKECLQNNKEDDSYMYQVDGTMSPEDH